MIGYKTLQQYFQKMLRWIKCIPRPLNTKLLSMQIYNRLVELNHHKLFLHSEAAQSEVQLAATSSDSQSAIVKLQVQECCINSRQGFNLECNNHQLRQWVVWLEETLKWIQPWELMKDSSSKLTRFNEFMIHLTEITFVKVLRVESMKGQRMRK